MFSCEFCEIYKNTFFAEHLQATASDLSMLDVTGLCKFNIFINKITEEIQ